MPCRLPSPGALCALALVLAAVAGLLHPRASAALEPELSRYLFVADPGSARIVVIDTVDDTVISALALPDPPVEVLVSAEAGLLVASHPASTTLSVLDLDRSGAARTLSVDHQADAIRLHPDGRLLAVSGTQAGRVTLVDLPTGRVTAQASGLSRPAAFTFSGTGEHLFVASEQGDTVSVVEVASGSVLRTVETGVVDSAGAASPVTGFARTPGGELGFVMHGAAGVVTILDLQTHAVAGHLRLEGAVRRAYPTANSQYVLVPDLHDGSVSVISTWTLRESGRFQVGGDVVDVDMGFFDTVAVAISRASRTAYLYDLTNEQILAEIELPGRPESAIPSANGLKLYVALGGEGQVAVIDLMRQEVVRLIDGVGPHPSALAMVTDASYCH